MNNLPKHDKRGSLWRKWDLHVHTPETKKNDQYRTKEGDVWDLFCEKIHNSDVKAIGICDYFSIDNYFTFIEKYYKKYPDSRKRFFPNIEVCTNDVVNVAGEEVHIHLIFNPDMDKLEENIKRFLNNLKTNETTSTGQNKLASELKTVEDFQKATTTRDYIDAALKTFRLKMEKEDYVLIVTAANNDGIRAGRGQKRKELISDELDKFSNAFFGNANNVDYFADENRLETEDKTNSKPVLTGSDSHSFDELDKFLGQNAFNTDGTILKQITWIKADLTYEGLKQIIYEPISGERIFIGSENSPDWKSADKVIRKLVFSGTDEFPFEVFFNDNLSSIIGSRSTGKSALLAYLAYGVDPEYAKDQKKDGPAAKILWEDLSMEIKVEWGDNLTQKGKVVYIPQNHLNKLSSDPAQITDMIMPVLFAKYPNIKHAYDNFQNNINNTYNRAIAEATRSWFLGKDNIKTHENEIKEIGDEQAIDEIIKSFENKIKELQKTSELDEKDVENYKGVSQKMHNNTVRQREIHDDLQKLSRFVITDENTGEENVVEFSVLFSFEPSIESLPRDLYKNITEATEKWSIDARNELREKILAYKKGLMEESKALVINSDELEEKNKDLLGRYQQNVQLRFLIKQLDEQKAKKDEINKITEQIAEEQKKLNGLTAKIKSDIDAREADLLNLEEEVRNCDQKDSNIQYDLELAFNDEKQNYLSEKFNKRDSSIFINADSKCLEIKHIRSKPLEFLNSIYEGKQKVLQRQDAKECTVKAFNFTEEIRFNATMEGDTIGGFSRSSMTEGKQALFALTLLLDKETDTWPLLIDQPEDDLDSRSIFDLIVPFLEQQKKKRQIIMVSHNANLVIGADSEQVIVANQHGDDRKNDGNRKFDYFSGALEFTKPRDVRNKIALKACGIREHACDILDGGKIAFEKRKHKYNI